MRKSTSVLLNSSRLHFWRRRRNKVFVLRWVLFCAHKWNFRHKNVRRRKLCRERIFLRKWWNQSKTSSFRFFRFEIRTKCTNEWMFFTFFCAEHVRYLILVNRFHKSEWVSESHWKVFSFFPFFRSINTYIHGNPVIMNHFVGAENSL